MSSRKSNALLADIGQLMVIGFDGTQLSSQLRTLLKRIQPAGVILFARNIANADQTCRLLKDCQSCVSMPLFTCVDMEGGRVDRFRDVLGPSPSAAGVFATGENRLFRKHGEIIGRCCRALGFNTDFAPVVDLAFEKSRKVMSSRVVSADPREVITYAREFLAGLRGAGVLGALKHFPGLGEADLDSHDKLPSVRKTWKRLWDEDLAPYRALRSSAPMVLIGHAAYPSVTRGKTPASLSEEWIREILRRRIGYRGLIISDDLEMGAVLKTVSIEDATVGHVRAGGNLALICHVEEHVIRGYEVLVKEAERNSAFARKCRESIARVLACKKKCNLRKAMSSSSTSDKAGRLARQLWEFAEQVRVEAMNAQRGNRRSRA
ncbi:MAG TPA: beta-N-acetylhexosaminidase [Terriglobales bacterium]|nr:beta-N-acetylhexosaminidase [Terriglobales bacterium]